MSTPMMQQYRDAKERPPGMLLLFRMGDFYELFDADADTGARVLGLTLTSRDKTVPMAGFPHHQLENYLHKLLRGGHRVAICDQVEDPAQAKGLVKREVIRVEPKPKMGYGVGVKLLRARDPIAPQKFGVALG